jgi:glycerol uptake facilitator protein
MATVTGSRSPVSHVLGRHAAWRSTLAGELISEFLGTFVLVALGDGAVATAVAALPESARTTSAFVAAGDWMLIAWGWGLAVVFGYYVAGGISKAHINPAVTVAMALRRGFPWARVPIYIVVQIAGGFVAAALIYGNYKGAIGAFEHAQHIVRGQATSVKSFSIFATFPAKYFTSWAGPFADQVIGTAFLVGLLFALVDEYNVPIKANLAGLFVGLVVVAIGISFGANAGYAINPARDLGPRLFTWLAGWGKVAMPGSFPGIGAYVWIPIVGPLLGAVLGACIYDFFIRTELVARGAEPDPEIVQAGRGAEEKSSAQHGTS